MDNQYSFPPPLNGRPSQESSSCTRNASGQQTCVRYSYPHQPIDIPQRRRRSSQEVFASGEHRRSGIGGYSNVYRRSGIGNNVPDDRNSGIGKLCYEEGGSRLSGSFSSLKNLSFKRGSLSAGSPDARRDSSGGESVGSRRGSIMSRETMVEIDAVSRSDSELPQDQPAKEKRHRKHSLRHIWRF
ncbi:hypothetical protein H4S02_001240 [Coemansia sp. RSA 2611]|nr:hypothetical protein H4S01_001722 [Coemansia sp. RSA 2610]KAJ2391603.1 hypothetical protein H4S02_001240 [Coemansia sp. RSA 2611]